MKVNSFLPILLFISQFGFSQTEKPIKGKVLCSDLPIQGIEVLNLVTEKTTITNDKGEFSILGKSEDMLVFVSEKYDYKRLLLEQKDINKPNLVIILTRKPEQLEEVVITKIKFPKIKFDKNIASQLNIEKAAKNPKPFGVYDGTIENGIGMIINLSGSRKKIPQIEFKKIVTTTCNQDYFNKTLQLKPEEVSLFLEFCDADPKSKIVLKNSNPLTLMDFLLAKNTEFKKLTRVENK